MKKKVEIVFPGYSKLMAYILARICMFPSQFSNEIPLLSEYQTYDYVEIKNEYKYGSEKVEQIFSSCPLAMRADS